MVISYFIPQIVSTRSCSISLTYNGANNSNDTRSDRAEKLHPSMNSLFYWSTIYLSSTVCHDTDIKAMFTDIKVNDDRKSAIFESDQDIFQGISFYESRYFVLYQWSS